MKVSSWISVTDRLPEPSRNHLCVSKGESELWTIAYYLGDERWLLAVPEKDPMSYHPFIIEGGISHWFDPATLPIDNLSAILHDECDRRDAENAT